MTPTDARCYVCDHAPHPPADHVYWAIPDAAAWFARQPEATPPPLTVDGVVVSYTT